jgi:hypothetical protein
MRPHSHRGCGAELRLAFHRAHFARKAANSAHELNDWEGLSPQAGAPTMRNATAVVLGTATSKASPSFRPAGGAVAVEGG